MLGVVQNILGVTCFVCYLWDNGDMPPKVGQRKPNTVTYTRKGTMPKLAMKDDHRASWAKDWDGISNSRF